MKKDAVKILNEGFKPNFDTVTYHRKPTKSEIKFGYGAIHWRDFPISECLKKDGTLKKRIKGKDDGLIYTQ